MQSLHNSSLGKDYEVYGPRRFYSRMFDLVREAEEMVRRSDNCDTAWREKKGETFQAEDTECTQAQWPMGNEKTWKNFDKVGVHRAKKTVNMMSL